MCLPSGETATSVLKGEMSRGDGGVKANLRSGGSGRDGAGLSSQAAARPMTSANASAAGCRQNGIGLSGGNAALFASTNAGPEASSR